MLSATRFTKCPYLKRTGASRRNSIPGYCEGYEDGRLRIPTIAEFTQYCTRLEHVECNVYRMRLAREAEKARSAA